MVVVNPDLGTPDDDGLKKLAADLDEMQRHLDSQVRRMDGVVDRIQARWQGPTGTAYRTLHNGAARDAVRIRETLRVLEEAVRLSRDGFTEQELDILARMRRVQDDTDVAREADALQSPAPAPEPGPRSRVHDL
ncbi:WXG100 family type VII secretion target [Streptomyces sp. NPDC079020]|uniref:WXG100 family type VII secretion target n=1 Tax=unclassified Streptomyces TaxID=2593676 RepID=UPI0022571D2E|nr:WXG100 family type VII secretion target [Streptomyces sp. NBC_00654]MCX4969437.1 WXG100 family type VII secretion target [Streptomyces sp. NBC_00654]